MVHLIVVKPISADSEDIIILGLYREISVKRKANNPRPNLQ